MGDGKTEGCGREYAGVVAWELDRALLPVGEQLEKGVGVGRICRMVGVGVEGSGRGWKSRGDGVGHRRWLVLGVGSSELGVAGWLACWLLPMLER